MTANQISSYLIEKSSQSNENDLTNLKLQKILFYAQAERLNTTGELLFENAIEAWKYGPLVPEIYSWLRGCGAYPITAFDIETDSSSLEKGLMEFLDGIWQKYGKYSAGYLVDKTHEAGSPWARVYEDGKNNVIEPELIKTAQLQAEWSN